MRENSKDLKQNIVTGFVAGFAVLMLLVVILAKNGVFKPKEKPTELETVIETEIVVASEINNEGEVVYYTMLNEYVKPKMTSNHRYPTTTGPSTTEEEKLYDEYTEIEKVYDENGNLVVDEDGVPWTKIVVHTVPITTKKENSTPKTSVVEVTDNLHKVLTDEFGNPLTEVVTVKADASSSNIWEKFPGSEEVTKKSILDITPSVSRDDNLASTIITQINQDREEEGLSPLSTETVVTAAARTNSLAMAVPSLYSLDSLYSNKFTFETEYGGKQLYDKIASEISGSAKSGDFSKIGVGVIKSADKYYTTIIFH